MLKLRDGTRKSDKIYLFTRTCIKPTNKLVSSLSRAPLVLGQATGNFGLTWLTTAWTRGKPPPSPISILCTFLRHLHPNGFLPRDSQGGVPKLSQFELPGLCEVIILCSNLRLRWGLKKTCSSHQELSNDVSHSTCTHRGWVDSRLLMVGVKLLDWLPAFLFAITYAADVQMAHASPFSTCTFW